MVDKKTSFTDAEKIWNPIEGIEYSLCDDMGISTIYLKILLPMNAIFGHEYGRYKVEGYAKVEGELRVICERI